MKKNELKRQKVAFVSIISILSVSALYFLPGSPLFSKRDNRNNTELLAAESASSEQRSNKENTLPAFASLQNRHNQTISTNNQKSKAKNSSDNKPRNSVECLQQSISVAEKLLSFSTEMKLEMYLAENVYMGIGEYSELSLRKEISYSHNKNSSDNEDESKYIEIRNPLEWNVFRLKVKLLPLNSKVSDPSQEDNIFVVTSDQRSLWRYSKIEGQERLQHIDIEDLANHLARLSDDEKRTLMQNGVTQACGMSGLPALGGMSGMLKNLLVNYDFQPDMISGTLKGNYPVWKLKGTMKKDVLGQMKKTLKGYNVNNANEENFDFLPTDIEMLVGMNSVFPCQIKYYCSRSNKHTLLMNITFTNINFNSIKENLDDFSYETPNKTYEQFGEQYLRDLIPGIEL